jgi:hypothetical protein
MRIEDIKPGMRLTWDYTPRGGYGYVTPVYVTVLSAGAKRVRVDAPLAGSTETKSVSVLPEKLRVRV